MCVICVVHVRARSCHTNDAQRIRDSGANLGEYFGNCVSGFTSFFGDSVQQKRDDNTLPTVRHDGVACHALLGPNLAFPDFLALSLDCPRRLRVQLRSRTRLRIGSMAFLFCTCFTIGFRDYSARIMQLNFPVGSERGG